MFYVAVLSAGTLQMQGTVQLQVQQCLVLLSELGLYLVSFRQITKLIFDHTDSLWHTVVKFKWLQIQILTLMGRI